MMIDLVNGGYQITDLLLPQTSLSLSEDEGKNLLLTVNVEDHAQLDNPAMLPASVVQKLLTDMTTILPEDLANSGLFTVEQTMEHGVPCVSFSFGTPVSHNTHITVFADHLYLALNTMFGQNTVTGGQKS